MTLHYAFPFQTEGMFIECIKCYVLDYKYKAYLPVAIQLLDASSRYRTNSKSKPGCLFIRDRLLSHSKKIVYIWSRPNSSGSDQILQVVAAKTLE